MRERDAYRQIDNSQKKTDKGDIKKETNGGQTDKRRAIGERRLENNKNLKRKNKLKFCKSIICKVFPVANILGKSSKW